MEVIQAIVLICQINVGMSQVNIKELAEYQKECQQFLSECVYKKAHKFSSNVDKLHMTIFGLLEFQSILLSCMKDRK